MGYCRSSWRGHPRRNDWRTRSWMGGKRGFIMDNTPNIESIDDFIARRTDRKADWDVLSFQAQVDAKYRRAQMRYVGGGGAGAHDDPNIIKAGHFTLSTMILPPGNEGPLHLHTDVEEVFFVLEG